MLAFGNLGAAAVRLALGSALPFVLPYYCTCHVMPRVFTLGQFSLIWLQPLDEAASEPADTGAAGGDNPFAALFQPAAQPAGGSAQQPAAGAPNEAPLPNPWAGAGGGGAAGGAAAGPGGLGSLGGLGGMGAVDPAQMQQVRWVGFGAMFLASFNNCMLSGCWLSWPLVFYAERRTDEHWGWGVGLSAAAGSAFAAATAAICGSRRMMYGPAAPHAHLLSPEC